MEKLFLILPNQDHRNMLMERTNALIKEWGQNEWKPGTPRGHFTGPHFDLTGWDLCEYGGYSRPRKPNLRPIRHSGPLRRSERSREHRMGRSSTSGAAVSVSFQSRPPTVESVTQATRSTVLPLCARPKGCFSMHRSQEAVTVERTLLAFWEEDRYEVEVRRPTGAAGRGRRARGLRRPDERQRRSGS